MEETVNKEVLKRAVAYAKGCIARGMDEDEAMRKAARKFFVKKNLIVNAMNGK